MIGHDPYPPEGAMMARPALHLLSLADLDRMEFPPTHWVVEDLIPAGTLILVVGRPKAGKSLLTIDLAASVALGETFLGRATTQGPAVLVPAEDALPLVRDRLWTRLLEERAAPLFVLPADGSLDQSIWLDDRASFEQLAAIVQERRPSLLVLDPLRELHHCKENEADEMAALLRPLRQLAHQTGAAIVLVHHRNKHASDPAQATRGSSAITGGVDVVVTLERTDEDDEGSLTPNQVLTLRTEGRYGPRQRLGARLGTDIRWHPTDAGGKDDLRTADRLRRHLAASSDPLTAEELAVATRAAPRTVQNALTALKNDGHVNRHGTGAKGDPYRYTAAQRDRDASGTKVSASSSGKEPMRPDTEGRIPASAGMIPVLPDGDCGGSPGACYACGMSNWWQRPGGGWVCGTCHPPPPLRSNPGITRQAT